ncbi:MAG: ABC transporter permease [Pseudomonadota bacterium]
MNLLSLAWKSARARAMTTILTIATVAISTALLLGVEKIRNGARASFEQTVSGTDLIVGARSGAINLLLYSVFRLGDPTANLSWESYEGFAGRPDVAWTVPMSLGDSHGGFRVLGTTTGYFEHYRYGERRPLSFASGAPFSGVYDAVLGAEAARRLGYELNDEFDVAHGLKSAGFAEHKDRPFRVVGVLKPTGTPVDRTIHVSLEGIEAVHIGWNNGGPSIGPRAQTGPPDLSAEDLQPDAITAFLVGLKSKSAVLRYQRDVNTYRGEALSAVIPGVALSQLWRVVGAAEQALRGVALFVVAAGLTGLLTTILTSLNERRREIAVLRSVGAKTRDVFFLLVLESTLVAAIGAVIGAVAINAALIFFAQPIEALAGFPLGGFALSAYDLYITGGVVLIGFLMGFVPGWLAYRQSLSDGLTVRI